MKTGKVLAACLFSVIFLGTMGCAAKKDEFLEDAVYPSDVTKEDCYVCGQNPDSPIYQAAGEENIGLVNLNSFESTKIDINRYKDGERLMKNIRFSTTMGWGSSQEKGYQFQYNMNCNRGYMDGKISLTEKNVLDVDKLAEYLCSDCLSETINSFTYDQEHWNLALVNYQTRELRPLEKSLLGFFMGDYKIGLNYDEPDNEIHIYAFYCPERYDESNYKEDDDVVTQVKTYCWENDIPFEPDQKAIDYLNQFKQISNLRFSGDKGSIQVEDFSDGEFRYIDIQKDGSYTLYEPEE